MKKSFTFNLKDLKPFDGKRTGYGGIQTLLDTCCQEVKRQIKKTPKVKEGDAWAMTGDTLVFCLWNRYAGDVWVQVMVCDRRLDLAFHS